MSHVPRLSPYLLTTLTLFLTAGSVNAQTGAKTLRVYAGVYTPTAATTVTAQTPRVNNALRDLAQKFTQQTGIKVEFVTPGYNYADSDTPENRAKWESFMQAGIASGTAPDITAVPQGPDQTGKGWFLNLDSAYATPNEFAKGNTKWSDLYRSKFFNKMVGVGDNHYVVPMAATYPYVVIGTFYNKTLMKQAGITGTPKTWEEWMGQLAQLKKAGIAPMAPFPVEAKSGSVWPMWSTLIPAFTQNLVPRVDTDKNGTVTQLEIAQAALKGIISTNNPGIREAFRQYKRQLAFYLPGWNAADVQAAWSQGKVAQKYGGFWELYSERSNTQRKFDFGFFPTLPVTSATSKLVTWTPKLAPTGEARLDGVDGPQGSFAVVKPSVEKNGTSAEAVKFLKFLTTPDANEYLVNENPDAIPAIKGAQPDPLWGQLANLPAADYSESAIYPYGLDGEQQANLQRETVLWGLGQKNDSAFFAAVQKDLMRAAQKYVDDSKKAK